MSFCDSQLPTEIAERLKRCLSHGRLAHAWLFAGPQGSGKELTARTLAKALNCLVHDDDCCAGGTGPKDEPCDSCQRMEDGSHPDLYWVKPESKSRRIKVNQIRDLESSLHLKPSQGRVKVGVVMDADCMVEEASNAFLKTLEEPPGNTVIILLSTQPQRLLSTIRSRCLKLSFGKQSPTVSRYRDQLLPLLARFCRAEQPPVVNCYRLLTDLNVLLQTMQSEIRARAVQEANLDQFQEIDAGVRDKLEDELAARIEGEYRGRREEVIEIMYRWFADILVCVEHLDESLLENRDSVTDLRRAAQGLTCDQALANLEAIDGIRIALSRHISDQFALEVGILKLHVGAAASG